ncbi:hypothetical protein AC579_9711 [Pseudocercospora musae]|uniref:LysM domain-containing protein n=1 Tax=Pseudocercospora musae TaxID=113226 RepID=A0A139I5Z7_9PEZI|nr:hypothetical protein AC579_9711 [Pseudocercospora musae]
MTFTNAEITQHRAVNSAPFLDSTPLSSSQTLFRKPDSLQLRPFLTSAHCNFDRAAKNSQSWYLAILFRNRKLGSSVYHIGISFNRAELPFTMRAATLIAALFSAPAFAGPVLKLRDTTPQDYNKTPKSPSTPSGYGSPLPYGSPDTPTSPLTPANSPTPYGSPDTPTSPSIPSGYGSPSPYGSPDTPTSPSLPANSPTPYGSPDTPTSPSTPADSPTPYGSPDTPTSPSIPSGYGSPSPYGSPDTPTSPSLPANSPTPYGSPDTPTSPSLPAHSPTPYGSTDTPTSPSIPSGYGSPSPYGSPQTPTSPTSPSGYGSPNPYGSNNGALGSAGTGSYPPAGSRTSPSTGTGSSSTRFKNSTICGASGFANYTVKSGDTLTSIAKNFSSGICDIAATNKITNPNLIILGQSLLIPLNCTKPNNSTCLPPPAPNATATCVAGLPNAYNIRSGDTLTNIAKDFNITLNSVLGANPNITNPDLIQVGQIINIPTCPKSSCKSVGTYTIVSGDLFIDLATKYHTSIGQIKALNPNVDPTKTQPGDLIILPKDCRNSTSAVA